PHAHKDWPFIRVAQLLREINTEQLHPTDGNNIIRLAIPVTGKIIGKDHPLLDKLQEAANEAGIKHSFAAVDISYKNWVPSRIERIGTERGVSYSGSVNLQSLVLPQMLGRLIDACDTLDRKTTHHHHGKRDAHTR